MLLLPLLQNALNYNGAWTVDRIAYLERFIKPSKLGSCETPAGVLHPVLGPPV